MRPGKLLAALLKATVFLGSAWLLVRMIDWRDFLGSLREVSPLAFAAAVAIDVACAFIMAERWHLLIAAAGHRLPYRVVAAYTMLGMFYNQILPGSVSGDAARVWCLGGRHTSWKKSAGIVLWDRILGMVALVMLALATMPFFWRGLMDPALAAAIWLTMLAGIIVFFALQGPAVLALAERLAAGLWGSLSGGREPGMVSDFFGGLRDFLSARWVMLKAVLLSLVVRGLWILGAWAISSSMGLSIPPAYYLFSISAVELIRLIPVSVQGLGVRELAFVFFLAPYGASAAQAALLSMLFFTALTVAGLAGGLIYAARGLWGGKDAC